MTAMAKAAADQTATAAVTAAVEMIRKAKLIEENAMRSKAQNQKRMIRFLTSHTNLHPLQQLMAQPLPLHLRGKPLQSQALRVLVSQPIFALKSVWQRCFKAIASSSSCRNCSRAC